VRESASGQVSTTVNPRASATGHDHRLTLEFTQSGRHIPLRSEETASDSESTFSAGLPRAVTEIDINDLTPGFLCARCFAPMKRAR
jgi:hypothetical protein